MRIFYFVIAIVFYCNLGYSQQKTDSLIRVFLISNHVVDTIVFKEKKNKNVTVTESNYYKKKEFEKRTRNNQISIYTFGSYSAHGDTYLLIELVPLSNSAYTSFFLGKNGIEQDLQQLLEIFKSDGELPNNDKIEAIQILLKVYKSN